MTPLYICTGFLDSGKTTFIMDTLMNQDWIVDGPTLLIQCEEGETEYTDTYCNDKGILLETVEDMSDLTARYMSDLHKTYHPAQVVIEFNGMWNLQEFLQSPFPKDWGLAGVYSTVNGQSLDMYLTNMRNILMNQLIESELIVVNRCSKELNRSSFRKAIKIQNPNAQLIFEALDGSIIEFSEEDLPYDITKDIIEVDDMDFGTWYVDAYENPERYIRKQITFLAQLFRPMGMNRSMFVPGRRIMTCCAEDIRFYGYPCKSDSALQFAQKSWARVTVRFEMDTKGREPRPILRLISMQPAEKPEQEVVSM